MGCSAHNTKDESGKKQQVGGQRDNVPESQGTPGYKQKKFVYLHNEHSCKRLKEDTSNWEPNLVDI